MNENKKILVYVQAYGLGDAAHMLPFFKILHQSFPSYQIYWAQAFSVDFSAAIWSCCPYLADVINLQIPHKLKDQLSYDFSESGLDQHEFEYIFDLNTRVIFSLLLKFRLKSSCFISKALGFRLSDIRPRYAFQADKSYRKNTNNFIQSLLLLSSITHECYAFDYKIPIKARYHMLAQKALPTGKNYVGFVLSGLDSKKHWSLENYMAVVDHYVRKSICPVFFLGPEEQAYRDKLIAAYPQAFMVPLMDRQTVEHEHSAPYYLALAERMIVILGNDCGPMHLLNCAVQPMVMLFGDTNPDRYGPRRAGVKILRAQQWGASYVNTIPVEAVIQAMDRVGMSELQESL